MSGIRATTVDEITFRGADTASTRAEKLELLRGAWIADRDQVTLSLSIVDLPLADSLEPLFIYRVRGEGWTFVAAFCFAEALVGATGTPILRIRKNGVEVGTITFAGQVGTVAFTDASFPDNSLLEIYPPVSADGTLDQLSVSLRVTIV